MEELTYRFNQAPASLDKKHGHWYYEHVIDGFIDHFLTPGDDPLYVNVIEGTRGDGSCLVVAFVVEGEVT